MGLKGDILKTCIKALGNRRGAEMVEAAISLPLIILTAMLLVRTFTFYLEILVAGTSAHAEALEKADSYGGIAMKVYKDKKEVHLLRGGVLLFDAKKEINTRCYLLNEDLMVRAGEVFK